MKLLRIAALCLTFGANVAVATDPVKLAPDTYLISLTSKAGIFASMSKLKRRQGLNFEL